MVNFKPGDIVFMPNDTGDYTHEGLLVLVLEDNKLITLTNFKTISRTLDEWQEIVEKFKTVDPKVYFSDDDALKIGNIKDLYQLSLEKYKGQHSDE